MYKKGQKAYLLISKRGSDGSTIYQVKETTVQSVGRKYIKVSPCHSWEETFTLENAIHHRKEGIGNNSILFENKEQIEDYLQCRNFLIWLYNQFSHVNLIDPNTSYPVKVMTEVVHSLFCADTSELRIRDVREFLETTLNTNGDNCLGWTDAEISEFLSNGGNRKQLLEKIREHSGESLIAIENT